MRPGRCPGRFELERCPGSFRDLLALTILGGLRRPAGVQLLPKGPCTCRGSFGPLLQTSFRAFQQLNCRLE